VPSVRSHGHRGDQYVELQVIVPKPVDERVRQLMKELEKIAPEDARKDIFEQAKA
jgi:molecular chaperone DnaJ